MKRRILVGILMAVVLVSMLAIPVYALDYQNVTVTATPAYMCIVIDNLTWTINGIVGEGVIDTSTTYYSNPLGDTTPPSAEVAAGECYFSLTNTSTIDITLTVDMENFTGGDANMTNGETGSAGATSYGAYSWYSGCTYADDKQIVKKNATGSEVLWTSATPGEDTKLGITISTQTDAWGGGGSSTSTMKVTAEAA